MRLEGVPRALLFKRTYHLLNVKRPINHALSLHLNHPRTQTRLNSSASHRGIPVF
jgi:hypothetical protein